MVRVLGLFAVLLGPGDVQAQAIPGGRPLLPGHRADVEVVRDGTSRYGQLIVTRDGGVHLERFDAETRRLATAVLLRASSPSRGWDDRIDPVRCAWCRLGPGAVLAEVRTPLASLLVTQHSLLPAR
jgi:hypothetical protein